MRKELMEIRGSFGARVYLRGTTGEKHEGEVFYTIDPRFNIDTVEFTRKLNATINAATARAMEKSACFYFLGKKQRPKKVNPKRLPRLAIHEGATGIEFENYHAFMGVSSKIVPKRPEKEKGLLGGKAVQTFPEAPETAGAEGPHGERLNVTLRKKEYLECVRKANGKLAEHGATLRKLHKMEDQETAWKIALKCLNRKNKPEMLEETSFHADSPAKYLLGEIISAKLAQKLAEKFTKLREKNKERTK